MLSRRLLIGIIFTVLTCEAAALSKLMTYLKRDGVIGGAFVVQYMTGLLI